jgi:hypothetical protein
MHPFAVQRSVLLQNQRSKGALRGGNPAKAMLGNFHSQEIL